MELNKETVYSFQEARDILKKWRDSNERKSEEVVTIWLNSLSDNVKKLGDEKWVVYEQVVIAALDIHNYGIAEDSIFELKTRFPNSARVKYLQVLRLQALERYDDALKALDSLISKDPTNSTAYKRKIAILKSQGKNIEAIKELADYLNKFMSDQEAWSELCELYLAEGDYSRANFCAEELILHNPHNYNVYQRAGDIRYTMGGIDNLKVAFNYYNQALKLNDKSMRALFGLFLAGSSIITNPKLLSAEKKDFCNTTSWAAEEISHRYNAQSDRKTEDVDNMLEGIMGNLQLQS